MPIRIDRVLQPEQPNEDVAWLCDGEWTLRPQAEALTEWLAANAATLPPGFYVADIGFKWRRDAGGGGAVFAPDTLRLMADLGMNLLLSEYPGFTDED